ncbi:MAG: hypothetical protein IKB61_03290, partial [Elusimicrobiaceae bacterium]|nr:hypothetical protein [Elusimicrobiaceae bacterium]
MMANKKNSPIFYYGLANTSAAGYFVCKQFLNRENNVVYLTANSSDSLEASIQYFAPKNTALLSFPEQKIGQMAVLHHLLTAQQPYVLIAQYNDWQTPLPAPADFKANTFTIHRGDTLRRADLLDILQHRGYSREDYTEVCGQYAVRGSVLDLFVSGEKFPFRLYFAGNRVESICTFDIDSQTTQEHIDTVSILPLVFQHTPATLKDYVENAQYVFDQPSADFDFASYEKAVVFSTFPIAQGTDCCLKANIEFKANFPLLDREVSTLIRQGLSVTVTCLNRGELDRLAEIMQDYEHLKNLPLMIAPLMQGFYSPKEKFAFITSADILNRRYRPISALKNFTLENA